MIDVIIFSKNRAAQLNMLLKSFKLFCKIESKVIVLYQETTEDFAAGYAKGVDSWDCFLCPEIDFKQDLIDLYNTRKSPFVMFLVDDIVFTREVERNNKYFETFKSNEQILSYSLRMGKNIRYDYNNKKEIAVPKLTDVNIWKWKDVKYPGGWQYPMSLDGNIFRWEDIEKFILDGTYNNPNTFESYMAKHAVKGKPYMICHDESRLVNVVLNRVQNKYKSRNMGVDLKELNDKWLAGGECKLANCSVERQRDSVHAECVIDFEVQV